MKYLKLVFGEVGHTFERSFNLIALTVFSFLLLEALVQFGGDNASGINSRWPELYMIMRAFAIMTWVEVSILWIRKLTTPKINVQDAMLRSDDEPMSAAIAYGVHVFQWAVRLLVFLKLADLF